MIKLYTFGPNFDLPDPSPFCQKSVAQLRMSGLDFELDTCDPRKAPKGKGPWMDDNGTVVPDSTFIRWHLETRHGIDFDPGLSEVQKATAWALEKMCEDHLYWVMMYERWAIDENFEKGPRTFFDIAPAIVRPLVARSVRKGVLRSLDGHGFGRHTHEELVQIATRGFDSLATILGDRPYLFGDVPCGADATIHAWVAGFMTDFFRTPTQAAIKEHANLVAYRDRGLAEWFPEIAT